MMFSDEKRFANNLVSSKRDGQMMAVQKATTEAHVGPGSYFAGARSDGWQKRSFSRREPMTPSKKSKELDRSDLYAHGVVTSYGAVAVPINSPKAMSPGPGYYDRDIFKSPKSMSSSQQRSPVYSPNGTLMSPRSTPRFAFDTSMVLKDGVLFVSHENTKKEVGPGHYSTPMSTMRTHSFNVRASAGKPALLSPNNAGTMSRKQSVTDVLSSASKQRAQSAPRMRR